MVNSLKMKDGPPVLVLGPLWKLEGAPVDEAVVAGEGGHHPREGRLDTKGDHDTCVEERRNWIRGSYDGKVP